MCAAAGSGKTRTRRNGNRCQERYKGKFHAPWAYLNLLRRGIFMRIKANGKEKVQTGFLIWRVVL
jgi:hypothetical protein